MSSEESLEELKSINLFVHEPNRLGILLLLLGHHRLTFAQVQKALDLTAGNLSSHAKRLEKAGYLRILKGFVNLKPRTILEITDNGKIALKNYIKSLNLILTEYFKV